MNYKKIYYQIIENRKKQLIDGYTEIHHIIPKSLGGTNNDDNLVKLSSREHFICHYLLAKMYPKDSFEWYKMNHAFMIMKWNSFNQNRYFNSRLYEKMRENFSSMMSVAQSGENNSQFGTIWINNSIENKKIKKYDTIPEGWVKGRVNVLSDQQRKNQSKNMLGKKRPIAPETKEKLRHSLLKYYAEKNKV